MLYFWSSYVPHTIQQRSLSVLATSSVRVSTTQPPRQLANRGSTVYTQPSVHGPIRTKKRNKKMDQPQREIYCLAGVVLSASCRELVYLLQPRKFQRYFLPGLSLSSYRSASALTYWMAILYMLFNVHWTSFHYKKLSSSTNSNRTMTFSFFLWVGVVFNV